MNIFCLCVCACFLRSWVCVDLGCFLFLQAWPALWVVSSPTRLDACCKSPITDRLIPSHFLGINSKQLGVCGWILFFLSLLLMIITFPVSIWMCLKVIPWEINWALYRS